MNKLSSVSVVIPVHGCLNLIEELNKRLIENLILVSKKYQIIYVDDSDDIEIWKKLKKICKTSKKIKSIKLSRNFGQHAAIYAGLENSTKTLAVFPVISVTGFCPTAVLLFTTTSTPLAVKFGKTTNP